MPRYIDADQIVYWIRHTSRDGLEDDVRRVAFKDAIERIPTANVQEVKHGKWIRDEDQDGWCCSECGHATNERMLKWYQEINCDICNICYRSAKPFYCSRCGAKMDLEEER